MNNVKSYLNKYSKHFSHLFNSNCRIVDVKNRSLEEMTGDALYFCNYCNSDCDLLNTYMYGCSEAFRWGGKYIYFCKAGFAFVAASVCDEIGELSLGLVLGPIIMGEKDDTIEYYRNTESEKEVGLMSNILTEKVNDIAEIMSAVADFRPGVSNSSAARVVQKQNELLNSIYTQKDIVSGSKDYPIELERRFEECIHEGDKERAQDVLNDLLGRIYNISNFDFNAIKIRVSEIVTLLSRAVIEAGADSNEIIHFTTQCISEINNSKSLESLSIWISSILHKYMQYSYGFDSVKHSDTVHRVIKYIKSNYKEKISLEAISSHVHFSKTYLSRIFKAETGENISTYINKVRIEKAKSLLSDKQMSLTDVAYEVGFEDQSYFTKVFKSIVGTSPKKYSENKKKY